MPWCRFTDPVSPETYGSITAISGADDIVAATGETKSGEITGADWDPDTDLSGAFYCNGARTQRGVPTSTASKQAAWNRRIGAAFRRQMDLTKDWWPTIGETVPAATATATPAELIDASISAEALLATRRWIQANGLICWTVVNNPIGSSILAAFTDAQISGMIAHYEFMGAFVDATTWATLGAGTQQGDGTVVSHWYRVFVGLPEANDSGEDVREQYATMSFASTDATPGTFYSDIFTQTAGVIDGGVQVPNAAFTALGGIPIPVTLPDLEELR